MAFTPVYPSSHDATYVKSTSQVNASYAAYRATDPSLSKTGSTLTHNWMSAFNSLTNQKFNILLADEEVVTRVYLENLHWGGDLTDRGIKNFSVYGTNDATAAANTTYADTTDLTLLGTFEADEHVAADQTDPQYFDLSDNETAYQYYVFRIADNCGDDEYMGIRHIELQTGEADPEGELQFVGGFSLSGTITGYNYALVQGSIRPASPQVEGTALVTILAAGNFYAPAPQVKGISGWIGNFVAPAPQISGYAVVPIMAIGNFAPPAPGISGVAMPSILASGNFDAGSPSASGVATVGIVASGNFNAGRPQISGAAGWAIVASGSFAPPAAGITGTADVERADISPLKFNRNHRCALSEPI